MVTHVSCPVCASKEVYSLLDTLHCKRCGNIWTEEKNIRSKYDIRNVETPVSNRTRTNAITDSTEKRMEKQLDEYLKKFNGKFNTNTITSNIGDIHMAMFRRYLKKCVKNKTLDEKKDQYGRHWYSRPD
jgi:uncharacterized Zn finger protein